MLKGKLWLLFAILTTLFWGAWGALIEIPEKAGFPATLGYIVWSLTMVPCALVALGIIKWKLEVDKKSYNSSFTGDIPGYSTSGNYYRDYFCYTCRLPYCRLKNNSYETQQDSL